MQAKISIFATAILLLANTAKTCLVYNGVGDASTLQATILDNGQSVCTFDGPVGPDGQFHFTCIAANFAAIVTPTGLVQYSDPSGSYVWQAVKAGSNQWSVCQPGCGNNECFSTTIHVGDSKINYGTLNPSDVVASNLSSLCSGGTCDSTPYDLTADYTDGSGTSTLTLTITVDGTYDKDNPAILNGLIEAVKATASNGWTSETVHWRSGAQGPHWDTTQQGDLNLYKHSSFFGVAISDEVSGQQTPWYLKVTLQSVVASSETGACAAVTGAAAAIFGAMNPVVGALLGVLSIGCGQIPGA